MMCSFDGRFENIISGMPIRKSTNKHQEILPIQIGRKFIALLNNMYIVYMKSIHREYIGVDTK